MHAADSYQPFIDLANDLLADRISERVLPKASSQLPFINEALLAELGDRAEEMSVFEPRHSWALATVIYSATKAQGQDLYLQSLAAWYVGRASNHWVQPQRAKAAILRARRGFLRLNEMGWIAACDWQMYALPWTRPDIPKAAKTLKHALEELQRLGFEQFVPHCRLALAYAQLLLGKYDDAKANIGASEAVFSATEDRLNRARCWLNEASCLRRENRIDEGLIKLYEALPVFEEDSPVDVAKTFYQIALCHLLRADELLQAKDYFSKAIELFRRHEIDLWHAMCVNNLGYVYLLTGSLEQANDHFEQARKGFTHHNVLGLLADNLNDNGKLNSLRGLPAISIQQFKQAEEIHQKLGLKSAAAIDEANLGEAYGLIGRYQDALHHLERAIERFKFFNNDLRLESSEKFIALIWTRLGQLDRALDHLDSATDYLEKTNKKVSFSSLYYYRASILFKQNHASEAIEYLRMTLNAATSHNMRPQAALARRLLGEALTRSSEITEAINCLEQAYSDFNEMGMVMEQVATLVSIGEYHTVTFEPEKAREAFENALELSEGSMPETDWRAHAGLASLAETRGDTQAEFNSYRLAITALQKIRNNFWQPVLAGSYLQTPSVLFDKAISHAAKIKASHDAINFIEQNKATTLLHQLEMEKSSPFSSKSQELANLKSEINWLRDQLRISFDAAGPVKSAGLSKKLRVQLIEKIRLYDTKMAHAERQSHANRTLTAIPSDFNLDLFRDFANSALGRRWLALDYYLTADALIIVMISPDDCQIYTSPLSYRITMALEMCALNRQPMTPSQSDLVILGDFLIPAVVGKALTPDTYLLLAPHEKLHTVPWAAIQPSSISESLALRCIPHAVPSLHILCVLWGRRKLRQVLPRDAGLMIAVSSFHGKDRDLHHVKDEVNALRVRLGSDGKLLVDNRATWQNVRQLKVNTALSHEATGKTPFNWLHVATHFSADPHTGRLSGITLWDGDIWLDQLRDLTPLPDLVTFSGCNSIFSVVYEGDEHMGLSSTCFISGANTIIGSIWPVVDESAAKFTISFYDNYFAGLGSAEAVAKTQRWMIEQGEAINSWASFISMGVP